jgi:hypothetical protein
MATNRPIVWLGAFLASVAVGCAGDRGSATFIPDSGFASVPDSGWVDVSGVALIGFYPVRTNDQLEKDPGLAGALDNFSYYIGNAMDSLTAAGADVHYRAGDTLWLRAGAHRWRFVRHADSSEIGYLFTDSLRRSVAVYGVQGSVELIAFAREFRETGRVTRR